MLKLSALHKMQNIYPTAINSLRVLPGSAIYPTALTGVIGSAYRWAEFTAKYYCACATYLHVKQINVAHVRWAQFIYQAG